MQNLSLNMDVEILICEWCFMFGEIVFIQLYIF